MSVRQPSEHDLWIWTGLLSVILVALHFATPPGANFEVLYIGLVFMSLWSSHRSYTYFVAALSTCLVMRVTLTKLITGDFVGIELCSSLLTTTMIWAAALLCVLRQRTIATESRLEGERQTAVLRNEQLEQATRELQAKNEQLAATRDVTVYTLAKVAESRDADTGRHLERICAYSMLLANELQKQSAFRHVIDQDFLTNLRQSSPLHDIGKVSVSDNILLKPARLTPDEYEQMKKHALVGSNILQDAISHKSEATFLDMAAIIARCHHERFDGQGYPTGLSGRSIPLPARIVALADVYDALTAERPYKEAYAPEMARNMIVAESGGAFDPDVVEAFLRRFDDFVEVQHRYPDKHVQIFGLAESLLAEYCT
jgi:putative two-component system response regulator